MKIRIKIPQLHFYMIAVFLSFAGCLDFRIYQITNNYIYYISIIAILLDFFIIKKINTEGMPLLFATVMYFIVVNLSQGGIMIGIKYAVIFISVYLFERIEVRDTFWKLGIFMALLYFLRYFFSAESYLREFEKQSAIYRGVNYINMINVNVPCFMVFVCLIFLAIYCKSKKIYREKIVLLIGTCLSILMSYALECRVTIYTSILVYIVFEIIPLSFFLNRNRVLFMVTGLFVIGCTFPFVVTTLPTSVTNTLFTGRELIWTNYKQILSNHPVAFLFGLGANSRNLVSLSGLTMHNSFLEMAFSFGFFGVFLYWLTAFRAIKLAFDRGISIKRCYLIVAYMIMLVFGYVNTAIQREFLFIFYSLFLGLCNNQIEEKSKNW